METTTGPLGQGITNCRSCGDCRKSSGGAVQQTGLTWLTTSLMCLSVTLFDGRYLARSVFTGGYAGSGRS
uniref:hypothetical protein n=1 Tax=Vibrio cholerae TaxID=666 RepID=UPI003F58F0A4